jgi:hypothetical protein
VLLGIGNVPISSFIAGLSVRIVLTEEFRMADVLPWANSTLKSGVVVSVLREAGVE